MSQHDGLAPVTWLADVRSSAVATSSASPGGDDEVRFSRADAASRAALIEAISLGALTRRDVSRVELIERLRAREITDVEAEAEAERLERVGLIDDAALAERLVERSRRRKGLGAAALRSELRRRSLDDAVIDVALADFDRDAERATAIEVATRRARSLCSLDRETAERRLASYLARRGFGGALVREAVEIALRPSGRGSAARVRFE